MRRITWSRALLALATAGALVVATAPVAIANKGGIPNSPNGKGKAGAPGHGGGTEEETPLAPANYIAMRGQLSQPIHSDITHEIIEIEAYDGEDLYLEITRPAGDGPWPVILEASPYHGTLADRAGTRMFPDPVDANGNKIGLTGYFAPRGYAVAMFDLRGTGRSTGCLDHLGQKDARDLTTVIEWLAGQPWSNGRVGMTGHSYVGSTPSIAAAQAPDGLATIVPSAGLASMYDHQFQAGVPYNLQWVGPMFAYEQLALYRDLPPGVPPPPVVGGGPSGDNFGNAPNPQIGCGWQNTSLTAGSGQVTGQYELWHAQRDWGERAADADIPIFMIHGVNDNAARIPAAEWFFGSRYMRPGDKVWLGQWDHGSTNGRCGDLHGFRALHPTCRFDQMKYAIHAWFDKHLMQRDVDTGPAVEIFLNGEAPVDVTRVFDPETLGGKVYASDGWPRPAVWQDLYLDATDLSLQTSEPAESGSATFGTTAEAVLAAVGRGSLTFNSAPVEQNTLFTGLPKLNLNASLSTGQITHLTVTLNRVTRNEAGAVTAREPMNICAIQPQLRHGIHDVAPVIPGEEMSLPMQCFTMGHWIPAGQSLELVVSTKTPHHATFGSTDRNITIYTGPNRSHYRLPVVPNATLHQDVPLRETYPVPAEPGPAQPGVEGEVIVPAPGGGTRIEPITAVGFEYDILAGFDNATMNVLATPNLPADIDLYLQKQTDGGWADVTAGESGDLDKETLTAGRLPAGHYRILVHNWAGGPVIVDLDITFLNRDGQEGGTGGTGTSSLELLANETASGYLPQA
jgi:predicted acyl esterase